ncbi:MAG TPA: glutamate--cysteine ligase [Candidatus Binatia bacterium]|jgi:glutamate--cysteine ligase|nr:glutamate--cysteine ligase [Candidatus Binatia bacterium]
MTDFRASGEAIAIESVDQLVEQLHLAGKPRDRWMIGTEYEKLAVDARTGAAVPYSGPRGIEVVLRELADRFGWQPKEEEGHVVALLRDGASITLEPGGQVELSGKQCDSLHCTYDEMMTHVRELSAVGADLGIAFLGLGMQPFSTLDEIEWVPKQRYRIMRDYMARVGTLGHRMMKQTATVQANIDYSDERDAMRKLRVGMGTAPIINAMFANSSVSEGRLNGQMSYRGHIWTDTDSARCGLLPFAFRDDARFADYVRWALDVPMYFVLRNGTYRTDGFTGVPFRRYLEQGANGERATLDDWNLHLTTLFPEIRLKGYIEFRSADSQPPERTVALPALVKGVFYDDDCLGAALDMVKRWTWEDCVALYRDVTRDALRAKMRGIPVVELARELLTIAEEGLRRQAVMNSAGQDERVHLVHLAEQISSGRSPARVIAEKWDGEWHRDLDRLIAFAAFRTS